jgi:hypothetical protein
MKTSHLIEVLSTIPVEDERSSRNILRAGLAAAVLLAIVICVTTLGLRSDLAMTPFKHDAAVKFLFLAGLLGANMFSFSHAVRPAFDRRLLLLPVLTMGLMTGYACVALSAADVGAGSGLLMGEAWLKCLTVVPAVALAPAGLLAWTARCWAPTDLRFGGLAWGMTSGSMAAIAYALHCSDDAAPFVAAWYGVAVMLCAGLGWWAGPRALRW